MPAVDDVDSKVSHLDCGPLRARAGACQRSPMFTPYHRTNPVSDFPMSRMHRELD
jgi:hypothetical protein